MQSKEGLLSKIVNDSRSVGIILIICTVFSLVFSNISNGENYIGFWNYAWEWPSWIGEKLPHDIMLVVNDILMAFFFFMVGLEIKRELKVGELSSLKQASFPVFAAIGGVLVPAGLYAIFNSGNPDTSHGWGIPMATDIAFALGILALIAKRVPLGLKVILAALAIIDDLMAIVVIALFYTGEESLSLLYLGISIALIAILVAMNMKKVRNISLYVILGVLLWYLVYNSGVHATLAAVVLAFTIPMEKAPKLEHKLHIPVSFIVLPIFALANTAIVFPSDFGAALNSNVSHGIMAGLMLGKPIGIFLLPFLMVKLKISSLPEGVLWKHILGMGMIAGIGFTMSIFISGLAFEDETYMDIAKISVLIASLISALIGVIYLIIIGNNKKQSEGKIKSI